MNDAEKIHLPPVRCRWGKTTSGKMGCHASGCGELFEIDHAGRVLVPRPNGFVEVCLQDLMPRKDVPAEAGAMCPFDPGACENCLVEAKRAADNLASYERVKFQLSQLVPELTVATAKLLEQSRQLALCRSPRADVWLWTEGDDNDPKSLACPVVMGPEVLRRLVREAHVWRDSLPKCHAEGGCKKIGVKWVTRHTLYCDDHGGAWLQDAPWAALVRQEGR